VVRHVRFHVNILLLRLPCSVRHVHPVSLVSRFSLYVVKITSATVMLVPLDGS
jgi:hypothetical protein